MQRSEPCVSPLGGAGQAKSLRLRRRKQSTDLAARPAQACFMFLVSPSPMVVTQAQGRESADSTWACLAWRSNALRRGAPGQ